MQKQGLVTSDEPDTDHRKIQEDIRSVVLRCGRGGTLPRPRPCQESYPLVNMLVLKVPDSCWMVAYARGAALSHRR